MDQRLVQESGQKQRRTDELQGSARSAEDDERGHERAPRSPPLYSKGPTTGYEALLGLCLQSRDTPPSSLSLSQMADKSQSGTLEDDEFVLFYKMLTQREDVLKVFHEYSADGQKLSQGDLEDFLREEQFEEGDIQQHAKQLIERYEPSDTGTHTPKKKVAGRHV